MFRIRFNDVGASALNCSLCVRAWPECTCLNKEAMLGVGVGVGCWKETVNNEITKLPCECETMEYKFCLTSNSLYDPRVKLSFRVLRVTWVVSRDPIKDHDDVNLDNVHSNIHTTSLPAVATVTLHPINSRNILKEQANSNSSIYRI